MLLVAVRPCPAPGSFSPNRYQATVVTAPRTDSANATATRNTSRRRVFIGTSWIAEPVVALGQSGRVGVSEFVAGRGRAEGLPDREVGGVFDGEGAVAVAAQSESDI